MAKHRRIGLLGLIVFDLMKISFTGGSLIYVFFFLPVYILQGWPDS